MATEKRAFQAEVSKLLNIVANSLYSEREVFVRELVSNAADACDKLRYLALTDESLAADDPDFKIRISIGKDAGTLTISDNGVGMSAEELHENLGTIARSGTSTFLESASGDENGDVNLIGQFGVGFYSAFMVSNKVEVLTRRAGSGEAFLWSSDGLGEYTVDSAEKASRGTLITMHLKDDATEFLEDARIEHIIKKYSDHISFPIVLEASEKAEDGEETADRTLNQASALWTRSKSEITEDQYKEFYHHSAHAFDDPWLTAHWKAEGVIEYTSLLFIPGSKPFDLFHPDRKHRVKLYVKKVFITDDCEGLIPSYLRFVKGVVDCEDLPLNISREMLQHNPVLTKIRSAVAKRIFSELTKKAEKETEAYDTFWENFGAVLKEGLYGESTEHRDQILELLRFRTTESDNLTGLKAYLERMKDGQDTIYYITGESQEALKASPHLEGFRAKGIEVLLLTDPIDDFWIPSMFDGYEGKSFKSVTSAGSDLDDFDSKDSEGDESEETKAEEENAADFAPLIAGIKLALGEKIKDVRESSRLTDSPVCLVAGEGDLDMNLERLLRQHQQVKDAAPRILEINPKHPLIIALGDKAKFDAASSDVEDAANLLLDQARIIEGEPVVDPVQFARRMSSVMKSALGG